MKERGFHVFVVVLSLGAFSSDEEPADLQFEFVPLGMGLQEHRPRLNQPLGVIHSGPEVSN